MKNLLIFTFALGLSIYNTSAQNSQVKNIKKLDKEASVFTEKGSWIKTKEQTNIKGSAYLFRSWANKTTLYFKDKVFKTNTFNYNLNSGRFESQKNDSTFILNPRGIEKIVINNKVFKRMLDVEYQRNAYFEEVVSTKKFAMFKKHVVKITPGHFNPMTLSKTTPDKYVKGEMYYLFDEQANGLVQTKLKKSTILNAMADKKDQVKSYIKENRLSVKNEKDLKRICKYYNTL